MRRGARYGGATGAERRIEVTLPSWILAIDFGTSYTVAASKIGDRSPEVIEIGGERRVPSVIMVDPRGAIVVGRVADDLSATHPESTLRALKNRLGDQAPVVLDGRPHQVVVLVAALLRQIYLDSVRQMGEPPTEVRLTHPATWNRPRLNRLLEAAAKAELPNPALVPEPVAAALSFASEVGVQSGAHVVVYDLGGGTFDTAVVTSNGGGFNIVGRPSGDQNIGGELFDEIIVNHLGQQLPPDAWEEIQVGDKPVWQQVGATLRNEARKAKETLSGNAYADLLVPLPTGLQQIRITREEFEELVRPYLAETVTLLGRCVAEAGLRTGDLAGISLVGGSSRSPIVEEMVKAAFPEVPVIRRGDPKTAVASGAARAVRSSIQPAPAAAGQTTQEASPGTARQSVRLAPPVSQPPTAPGAGPGTGPGSGQTAAPSVPPRPGGTSVTPSPSSLPSRPPSLAETQVISDLRPGSPSVPPGSGTMAGASVPPPAGHGAQPPAHGAASTTGPLPSAPASMKTRSRRPLVLLVVLVLVAAAAGAFLLTRGSGDEEPGQPTRAALDAALLPIREIRDALGSGWNASEPSEGDPFCEQFALEEPTRVRESLFVAEETTEDGTLVFKYVSERLSSFPTPEGASIAFEQDRAITKSCPTEETLYGDTPVTITITDTTDDVESLGDDVISIKYVGSATDGSADNLSTGYIAVRLIGSLVISTSYELSNRDITDDEFDTFLELTKAAYARVDESL